jgi:hypothetical protein
MAKALQCDNCKEFFSISNRNFSEKKSYSDVNNIAFSISDNLGQQLYRSYDICPSCMRHVKDALSVLVKEV